MSEGNDTEVTDAFTLGKALKQYSPNKGSP